MSQKSFGYQGELARVDLTRKAVTFDALDNEDTLHKFVGGAALGIKYLYDEVSPGTEWSDPDNRLFLFSGPLGGTAVGGSGTIAAVTVGALTNGVTSSQANGYFGAFLRLSGFDGLILQGTSPEWVYLYIHDHTVEFRDARRLLDKNTYDTEQAIKEELQGKNISILSIGPAGENKVRFAAVTVDNGHIAAHNGIGAVMGSKKVKAIAVARGFKTPPLKNKEEFSRMAKEIRAATMADKYYWTTSNFGTLTAIIGGSKAGFIPVKNYTTNVHVISPEKLNDYTPQNIRAKFAARPKPCWACSSHHCNVSEIGEGKYAGRQVEEPEYEGFAAFSSLVGIDNVTDSILLASEVDRLGMDTNEAGWVISWVMECYEKGIFTREDTDGLEMTWGNADAIMTMLSRIAHRQGLGDTLAEGVMRASERIGGKTPEMAIYSLKGNTPRSHDHRAMWLEMFDTCVSNLGTLETQMKAPFKLLGMPETFDGFDPEAVSTVEARIKGAMIFEDSMVTCRFRTATAIDLLSRAINAATGWKIDYNDAMKIGRRAVNLARVFNLRAGISAELDAPSVRYGSALPDGPSAGKSIMQHWDYMLHNYYRLMGWDESSGKPLPQTLTSLGLEHTIPVLWPEGK